MNFFLVTMLSCGAGTLLWSAWYLSKDEIGPGEIMNKENELKLSADTISLLKKEAELKKRTIDEQANHWIKLGRLTEFGKKTTKS